MHDRFVSILMGSESDLSLIKYTVDILKSFEIKTEVKIASAHRTPDLLAEYIEDAQKRGVMVFICAAGLAAHLAGAVAARTVRPVIGIPVDGGPLNGVDALYSTVQMPGGIPVATVAIGRAGAKNAAYLAAQIMALTDPVVEAKVLLDRENAKTAVIKKNDTLDQYFNDKPAP